ncbi:unnamed protein product [Lymnaea stagnalis]|uniref:Uncharacterized protein n=1 Tax=Lymnaea stagnalis TaxID=6523 RepID=A0AAV2H674_LYMST
MEAKLCRGAMGCHVKTVSKILFRLGQLILLGGMVCYLVSVATPHWVDRPTVDDAAENINLTLTLVTKNFGIFKACRQTASGRSNKGGDDRNDHDDCGSLWDNINYISPHAARYVQFVMVAAGIMYTLGFLLEIVQVVPMKKFRNFVAKNRMVEMFVSIATVLVLQGMLIFAGEIKNKAQRVSGQEDEQSGWSFVVALIGVLLSVFGLVLVTMFRELPMPSKNEDGGSWLKHSSGNVPQTSLRS